MLRQGRLLYALGAIPNFAPRGSHQSIEPKAVLEHRAPKRSVSALTHLQDSIFTRNATELI